MRTSLDTALLELEEDEALASAHDQELRRNLEKIERELPLEPLPPAPTKETKDIYDLIDEASAGLAQDGRDYIAALFWMATSAGFSDPSISLLCAVAAYEDCRELDERGCEITDAELAEFIGCSKRTVQRKRSQYLKEEKHLKVPFLRITEGDFDKAQEKNRPTRYQFLRDRDVADAVLEARTTAAYAADRRKALKLSALRGYDSLPQSQGAIRRRKKKMLSIDSERQRILNTIRTSVARLKEIQSKMEGNFSDDWETLKDELETIYSSTNPAQTVAEIKHNPMGRQFVAPSIPHVAVNKDMPSDVPVSEYLRVPSIAREVRRAGQYQEGTHFDKGERKKRRLYDQPLLRKVDETAGD
jgi:hypothetical protein